MDQKSKASLAKVISMIGNNGSNKKVDLDVVLSVTDSQTTVDELKPAAVTNPEGGNVSVASSKKKKKVGSSKGKGKGNKKGNKKGKVAASSRKGPSIPVELPSIKQSASAVKRQVLEELEEMRRRGVFPERTPLNNMPNTEVEPLQFQDFDEKTRGAAVCTEAAPRARARRRCSSAPGGGASFVLPGDTTVDRSDGSSSSMRIVVTVGNKTFEVQCGEGQQSVRWLGMLACQRFFGKPGGGVPEGTPVS
jgi:hypothetical protein